MNGLGPINTMGALEEAEVAIKRLEREVKEKYSDQFRPLRDPLQDTHDKFKLLRETVLQRHGNIPAEKIPSDDELTLDERSIFRQFKSCVNTADRDLTAEEV